MKTKKFFLAVCICLLPGGLLPLMAQTYHVDLVGECTNVPVLCMNHWVTGYWSYNLTYHINPKTGAFENLHFNTRQVRLYDAVTGEKYKLIDVGNDRLGGWWDWLNNINAYNEAVLSTLNADPPPELIYNQEDGYLPYTELPDEGTLIGFTKFIGKHGVMYTWKVRWVFHLNANREITVDFYHETVDCE